MSDAGWLLMRMAWRKAKSRQEGACNTLATRGQRNAVKCTDVAQVSADLCASTRLPRTATADDRAAAALHGLRACAQSPSRPGQLRGSRTDSTSVTPVASPANTAKLTPAAPPDLAALGPSGSGVPGATSMPFKAAHYVSSCTQVTPVLALCSRRRQLRPRYAVWPSRTWVINPYLCAYMYTCQGSVSSAALSRQQQTPGLVRLHSSAPSIHAITKRVAGGLGAQQVAECIT